MMAFAIWGANTMSHKSNESVSDYVKYGLFFFALGMLVTAAFR